VIDYRRLAALHEHWLDHPGYALEPDFPREEYELRLARARERMAAARLDALVITSGAVGQWFTSALEPHEWHDRCPARTAWFILTPDGDHLYMTPTTAGEHFNTTRRTTWVTHIRAIVERTTWPRHEIWDLAQMPALFADLGLDRSRLGFELGDCMTLGLSVSDFLRLRELMPDAQLVDGSDVIRWLMSVHTPLEIERLRRACEAGVWMHAQVPRLLRVGLTEREFLARMAAAFRDRWGEGYSYRETGGWDVRNPGRGDANFFHAVATDRVFQLGDLLFRASSGVTYRGYYADNDRLWHLGPPPEVVREWYRVTWECNRAMAEAIKPGHRCSDVYAACARVERRHGFPLREVGRIGHGLRNTGGLSVHPDNHTVLEPGMVISVEPMFAAVHGFYDLEDQYLVTETGREALHELAPEELPVIAA
jgi:Xaa-Pro aminopeptidase